MRTTLNLDDALMRKAREYTGIEEKTALIHEALRHLIAREAGKRLAALWGDNARFQTPTAQAQFRRDDENDPGRLFSLDQALPDMRSRASTRCWSMNSFRCTHSYWVSWPAGICHKRAETIADLEDLPVAAVASEPEVLHLLESRRLWGTGLGWVDLHLLASALIEESKLWTADRAVAAAADRLGVAFPGSRT
jgi:Arc/MetJ family transcription regulator